MRIFGSCPAPDAMALNIKKYTIPSGGLCSALVVAIVAILVGAAGCNKFSSQKDVYYDSLLLPLTRGYAAGHDVKYKNKIDSIYAATPNPPARLKYLRASFLSGYYYDNEKGDLARAMLDSAIEAMETGELTEKYPLDYARLLNDKGDYCFFDKNLEKAFQYYYKSRSIRVSYKDDSCALSNETYHLGMVSFRQERYLESAEYFKQSISELNHCGQGFEVFNRHQEEYNNIALAYTRMGMNDSALEYYRHALDYIDTAGSHQGDIPKHVRQIEEAAGVVYGNMAKIFLAQQQFDTAERYLLRSVAINARPLYENRDAMFSNITLAELYYQQGKTEQVRTLMSDLRLALDTMENKQVEQRWFQLMYKLKKDARSPVEALTYLENYEKLRDSLFNAQQVLKKTDYGSMLKDQEAQYQIRLLKKDNQLSKLYLWSTFAVVGVAIFIIALVYYYYRRGRGNISTLTSLNLQVNEQKSQLEEAMVQLKENNDDKDRILRIVAHDLRTPINGIMMISDFALEEEDDPSKRESLNMIISASKNLLHLTNELLEFSGNASQVEKGTLEDANLNELLRQSIGLLMFKAQEKKQVITLATAPFPVAVHIQREKISRVLGNLISNALKFSKEGAVVKVTLSATDTKALVKVEDFGIGIPEKMLPHIFEPFTMAKRHGTNGERSYGLGLSICMQIVTAHKGRIWAESKEGEGSIFYVELPRIIAEQPAEATKA